MSNSSHWKALVICPNKRLSGEFLSVLSHQLPFVPVVDTPVYPDRREVAQALKLQPCNLCFLDIGTQPERALNVIADLRAADPRIKIFALTAQNDADLVLRCLRAGANDFLTEPYTAEHVAPVFEKHLKSVDGQGTPNGRVYCVMPAKGATGSTTVATHLAFQLKKSGAKRVLLADLDPLTGTVAFILKVKCQYSFLDVLSRASILDDDLWRGMVTSSGGVDVLLPPEFLVEGTGDLHDASIIIHYARRAYDAVVLDSAHGFGDWSLTTARLCDDLLLVTTNELPSLQAAQRTLAYLEANQVHRSKIRIVVNRYSRDAGLSREVIGTALHTEVYHVLPSDFESVQKAVLEGKPVPAGTHFGKAIAVLAERLNGKEGPARNKTSGFGGLRALFSRG
jgi:pilus assembly protein CpaE